MTIRLGVEKLYIIFQLIVLFFFSYFYRVNNNFIVILSAINLSMLFYLSSKKKCSLQRNEFLIIVGAIALSFIHYFLAKYYMTIEIFYLLLPITYAMIFKRLFLRGYFNMILKQFRNFSFIMGVYCVLEALIKTNPIYNGLFGEYAFNASLYPLRGSFGEPLIVAFVFTITLLVLCLSDKKNIFNVFSIILCVFVCIFTGKRTGMVFSVLGIIMIYTIPILIKRKFKISNNTIIAAVSMSMIVILLGFGIKLNGSSIWSYLIKNIATLFDSSADGYMSIYHRSSAISLSLDHFKNNGIIRMVLGSGYRSLYLYFSMNGISITKTGFYVVDNTYITSLNDFGALVVIGYIAYSVKLIYKLLRIIRGAGNQTLTMLSSCALTLVFFVDIYIFLFDAIGWFPGVIMIGFSISFAQYVISMARKIA